MGGAPPLQCHPAGEQRYVFYADFDDQHHHSYSTFSHHTQGKLWWFQDERFRFLLKLRQLNNIVYIET